MDFLFPREDTENWDSDDFDSYTVDGKEYGKWDVPVFIILNGIAYGQEKNNSFQMCAFQMRSHGFIPDFFKLEKIFQVAGEKCKNEIRAIIVTDERFNSEEEPLLIFNDIKDSL